MAANRRRAGIVDNAETATPISLAFGGLLLHTPLSRFAIGVTLVTLLPVALIAQSDGPPAGVEQILERGGIPAIFEPQFVAAPEADIAADAWVLGVFADGVAKAYSLNLLNHHEVVNDSIGEKTFAAVW